VNTNRNRDNPVSFIDRTVEKTHVWLSDVSQRIGVDDKHVAYLVLRSVLHALRDLLDADTSAHLAAQLPMLVRGLYYEGWNPRDKPVRMSYDDFLARIEADALLKGTSEAEDSARAVFAVLWAQLGDGVMNKIASVLPGDYERLL
jgi:uncharacterized protein (DUF2267 family)